MSRLRGVGVIRLSSHSNLPDDPSTSPERQRERIIGIALAKGIEIVGWAEDLNVSAKVAPWDRPKLGEWLRQPEAWDALLFWKTDRVVRSTRDFIDLMDWVRGQPTHAPLPPVDSRKNLISADGDLDLSTPMGRAVAKIIATLGEAELEVVRERTADSRTALRYDGRWPGGTTPYGWIPQRQPGGGWKLALNPETSPVVLDIIKKVVEGKSLSSIAASLNDQGVLSPLNYARQKRIEAEKPSKPIDPAKVWTHPTLTKILRNELLIGRATHRGETVKGPDRMPIDYAAPMIDERQWKVLQSALDRTTKPQDRTRTRHTSLLLNIAKCAHCGKWMYLRTQKVKGSLYRYYGCSGKWHPADPKEPCQAGNIRVDSLNDAFESLLMRRIGDLEVLRKEVVPAEDHSEEIEEIDVALDELAADRAAGLFRGDAGTARYRGLVDRLEQRREELEALPTTEATERWVGTGQTYWELWAANDNLGQRQMLLQSGITARVARSLKDLDLIELDGVPEYSVSHTDPLVILQLPPELEERMMGAALSALSSMMYA